ncbi:mediator of RNA polymerase II transcription subunit 4 [Cocos nucifera]|uniref:Mediator of RNA polymerase II transcription subunit 4 n=1 Tax=Cocos nucifera TaxID=13894 RepID=A0A8K0N6F8_COCNU|nr:mediator of RNA polymerase II transcription subunit 4 [Cocos nucifera]
MTNAHSPSLPPNPSPNPNSNPKPAAPSSSSSSATVPTAGHHHPAAAATTTSSALLSLLPPLPRAQALLAQMASLATKLFDVSPQRAHWLASFRGSLPSFLPSASAPAAPLPSSSSSSSSSAAPSSSKEVVALFTALQTQIFEAVAELQEILDLQDSRLKLAREIRAKDSTLLSFTKKIREAEQVLDQLVDDYSDYRRDPKRPKSNQDPSDSGYSTSLRSSLDLQEILSYAHRISYTTFAPPEHGAGLAPLRGALPPAPQDNEMRASQLYHFADLDVGVPKKAPEAKERAADALAEPPLMEPTPPREEAPVPIPPMLPITVPPGWRKGMPIELPSELPPPPPGWKPGDPITLPLDGVVVGNREEQRVGGIPGMPGVPAPPPKASEAIQVKYVQLDINPDQDDYSSDYSSDVGSSEEDDED